MNETPVILALDTSVGCSVTLWRNSGAVSVREETKSGEQSRILLPLIEEALAEAGAAYRDLDAVACTLGPGGFTSIRVGLATARAIALTTGKALIGLGTLEVMAAASRIEGDIVSVIDAHRGQCYAQRFRANGILHAQSDALLVDEAAVKTLAHGAKIVQAPPHATDAARLAEMKWQRGEREFATAPLYIREPDAKLPASRPAQADELL